MPVQPFPPELILEIIDTFIDNFPSHAVRIPNLASFALVSRTFHSIANPLLYRNVYLTSKNRLKILDTLSRDVDLARSLQTLTVSGQALSNEEYARLDTVFSRCRNVLSLTYFAFEPDKLSSFSRFVATNWSSTLRYLRADQKEGLYELLLELPQLETLIATSIDYPISSSSTISPLPSTRSTMPSTSPPSVAPSFHLKRFDSGSSPLPHDFTLLTTTSHSSLTTLDLPVSSRSPLQDLSQFSHLERLTFTLAERYIPSQHDLDRRHRSQHGSTSGSLVVPSSERNDRQCLLQMKRLLETATQYLEQQGDRILPRLTKLELYEPNYDQTLPFSPEVFEAVDLFEWTPQTVEELDLATVDVGIEYLLRKLGSARSVNECIEEAKKEKRIECCSGLKKIVLKRGKVTVEQRIDVEATLEERGIVVEWL